MSTQDILAADVSKAVELLEALTAKPTREGVGYDIHPALVANSQALVFVFHKKAGLVLGLDRGHGFAIARLGTKEDGTAEWSAPSFLEATSVTLGATIGKSEASAVSLVLSETAAKFVAAQGTLHAALSASADIALSQKWRTNDYSLDALIAEDVVSAGLADGALVDLSAGVSSFRVAQALNEELYGAGKAPKDILTALVPPPPQFAELYDKVNQIIRVSKTLPPLRQ